MVNDETTPSLHLRIAGVRKNTDCHRKGEELSHGETFIVHFPGPALGNNGLNFSRGVLEKSLRDSSGIELEFLLG